jgi:hypothetical protein
LIDHFEPVSFSDDPRMVPGNDGQVLGKPHLTRSVASDGDLRVGDFLDLPSHGALDVHKLN